MTKRPLRSIPPAPVPAMTLYTSEDAARTAAPKPGKGQIVEILEVKPGLWGWATGVEKPAAKAQPSKSKPTNRKGGDA